MKKRPLLVVGATCLALLLLVGSFHWRQARGSGRPTGETIRFRESLKGVTFIVVTQGMWMEDLPPFILRGQDVRHTIAAIDFEPKPRGVTYVGVTSSGTHCFEFVRAKKVVATIRLEGGGFPSINPRDLSWGAPSLAMLRQFQKLAHQYDKATNRYAGQRNGK